MRWTAEQIMKKTMLFLYETASKYDWARDIRFGLFILFFILNFLFYLFFSLIFSLSDLLLLLVVGWWCEWWLMYSESLLPLPLLVAGDRVRQFCTQIDFCGKKRLKTMRRGDRVKGLLDRFWFPIGMYVAKEWRLIEFSFVLFWNGV